MSSRVFQYFPVNQRLVKQLELQGKQVFVKADSLVTSNLKEASIYTDIARKKGKIPV